MIAPYVTSGPVTGSEFYGREGLMAEILGGSQRATYVLGRRQVGKSSLLRQVETLVPSLFLDVQWAGGRLENLIRQAHREIRCKRGQHDWLPPENTLPPADLFSLLETVNDVAQAVGQRVWVLLDETERLLELARLDPEVLHRLRGTIQNCSALRVVLVAAKALSEANDLTAASGSPFLSGFALRYLGGLNPGASAKLLRRSQGPTPVAVDDALVAHLIHLTNGHPLLLQLLGERLFDDGRLRHPAQGDLDAILDPCLKTAIFDKDFAYLTDVERQVLHALVEGEPVPVNVDPAFLHGLTQLGYLRREGDSYATGNAFFARWLRQSAPWGEKSRVSNESTLDLYKEGSKDMSTDPALRQWAMNILTAATTWLFTQAGEVLKERREKRQAEQKPAAPPAEPQPATPPPITTADDLLAELRRKADLAACRMDVETVQSLMQRLEERAAKINRYREEEAKGLGLDDRVLAPQRIKAEQEQVVREAEEMRLILERLAGRPLQIPDPEQLEGEIGKGDTI